MLLQLTMAKLRSALSVECVSAALTALPLSTTAVTMNRAILLRLQCVIRHFACPELPRLTHCVPGVDSSFNYQKRSLVTQACSHA